jgi:predicted helicase
MSVSAIQSYYQELAKIDRHGGDNKETAIRSAFHNLLNGYCQNKGFQLVDELEYKNTRNYPDGTVKDNLRQDWGYWEAKDTDDDLDKEISKKLTKGYPSDNILFENSQTAILIQEGQEVMRIEMSDPQKLDKILKKLLDYKKPEILDFEKAIDEFSQNVPNIVKALRELIQAEIVNKNQNFLTQQELFLEICRDAINPQITTADIQEMLIQHILTEDIFLSVFDESQFHHENNIAKQLFALEQTFLTGQTKRDLLTAISHYYKIIRARASQISNHHEKQKFLKMVYENFYKHYNPDKADTLGVVYTPNEIVKFIIEGCNYLSQIHFGKTLGDKNVKILDPATGTGTFITELIDYLPAQTLEYKYKEEIFCNEIAILPYYVANLNIEYTYQQKTNKYLEFKNIALVDTLDNVFFGGKYKDSQQDDVFGSVSLENSQRIQRQNDQEISIILGNPPYNANQMNFNDNNANRTYPEVDERIKKTYIAKSNAQKTKMYDMYSRFFRWASDRIKDNGIVAFVTNSSFVDSRTFDGFRKSIMKEFDYIFVLDCGGNVRAGDTSGNVFDIMAGVAICFLIKKEEDPDLPKWSQPDKVPCQLYYHKLEEIGKTNKLQEIGFLAQKFNKIPFNKIIPDKDGNWLNQSQTDWQTLIPVASKKQTEKAIFDFYSNGVATKRDYWVYDLDKTNLIHKVQFFIKEYNESLERYKNPSSPREATTVSPKTLQVGDSTLSDKIKWSHTMLANLKAGKKLTFDETKIVCSHNRPFVKKWFYGEKLMSDRLTQNHYDMFGDGLDLENSCILISANLQIDLTTFSTNKVSDDNCNGRPTATFPRYRYQKDEKENKLIKIDNISNWALEQFRARYKNPPLRTDNQDDAKYSPLEGWQLQVDGVFCVTKDAIFCYIYGVLNSPDYQTKYQTELKRDFPRIPFYDDFWQFAELGKKLLDLHTNFDQITQKSFEIYDNPEVDDKNLEPILKISKNQTEIILDQKTSLRGLEPQVLEYKLGNRSAIEWILEQYKPQKTENSTTSKTFDYYDWKTLKPQIIRLLEQVTWVSQQTIESLQPHKTN